MAHWKVYFIGVRVNGMAPDGWPNAEIYRFTKEFETPHIFHLYQCHPLRWIKEETPELLENLHGVRQLGFERTDKKTKYGYVDTSMDEYNHSGRNVDAVMIFDRSLIDQLDQLREHIINRVLQGEHPKDRTSRLLFGPDIFVHQLSDSLAYITRYMGGLVNRKEALELATAITKFYERITDDELIVLGIDTSEVSIEEIEALHRVSLVTA